MSMRTIGLISLTLGVGFIGAGCGGSSDGSGGGDRSRGEACTLDSECASGECDKGKCGAPHDPKGSGGTLGTGTGGTSSGSGGSSGSSGSSGSAGGSSGPPGFTGSGSAGVPIKEGCGPDTANQCGGTCERAGGSGSPTVIVRPPVSLCFAGEEDPTPANPTALIEQVIEKINGVAMVHLRITFDPSFVDNTYGANAIGWGGGEATDPMGGMMPPKKKGGHTFNDLVGSDHLELLLTDGSGATVMDFKIDYVSVDASSSCGYGSLGVTGGEGKVIQGDASAVLGVATSIDRNLGGCGYCYTEDSPATDAAYTPNADAPNWDYRVVYEVWIALDAFGSAGFGQAYIQNVHASPSKLATNTVDVTATPCPPGWDMPFCPPELVQQDGTCGKTGKCPPNYEVYIATEGREICTPIPFGGYPGMKPCPEGYELDAATEGRYCLPVE
ncbi:MAG TPA: hypothetical protein VFZ53_25070 [Polyangiaceae bacterium]